MAAAFNTAAETTKEKQKRLLKEPIMSSSATVPGDMDVQDVHAFLDSRTEPDLYHEYRGKYDTEDDIIVIDNGSYNMRVGWHREDSPTLVYKPVLSRTRKEKGRDSELVVANDLANLEAFRFALRTPFDKNVVTQMEVMETMLDYGFAHLGLNGEEAEDLTVSKHPVVITEAMVNPNVARGMMSELLFECYSVPKVAYGVDALFSMKQQHSNALIVSCGFHTVHIIPLVNGEVSVDGVRRINVGGFHLINYMQRILQMKYPAHLNNITISRAEELLHNHCYIVEEYSPALNRCSAANAVADPVRRMQLPFTPAQRPPPVDPEVLRLRRQEMAKRLVEMNAKKREEKLAEDESLLKSLLTCSNLYEQGYDEKVKRILTKYSLTAKDSQELDELIAKTRARIEKCKSAMAAKKQLGDAAADEDPQPPEPKRKRTREEMGEEERSKFDDWLADVRDKRQELLDRRAARHLRKQQLAKRRTAASQERMRMISQLAKNSKKDDNFGMNDDDWDVYKQIRKDVGDSDSEEEQLRLSEYECVLKENDPAFAAAAAEEAEVAHDSPEWYQLHLAAERFRVAEILFQPSMIGVEQAGISETIEFVLKKYPAAVQDLLVNNIVLTGSLAKLPGFRERVERDVREFRPFRSSLRVTTTLETGADPAGLDAWKGAALWARHNDEGYITRQEYMEKGGEYLKEHNCSNRYWPSPDPVVVPTATE